MTQYKLKTTLFTNPMYFYVLTLSLIYIPTSSATSVPLFLLSALVNLLLLRKFELINSYLLHMLVLTLLIPLNLLIALFILPRLMDGEGNVFAFSLIFVAIPIFILNLIALLRYPKKNIDKSSLDSNKPREIRMENIDNTFKLFIPDKKDYTFESLKNKLIKQYSLLGFKNIVIDKKSKWMIKNKDVNESYILLSYVGDEYIVEVYNSIKPDIN